MSIFKSLVTLASTPIRCLGELGNDLSSLTDCRKDEADGTLSIATLGVKSIKKARLIFLIQFNGVFHFRELICEVEEPKEHLSLKNINAIERKAHNLFGNEYVNKHIQVCLISYMLLED